MAGKVYASLVLNKQILLQLLVVLLLTSSISTETLAEPVKVRGATNAVWKFPCPENEIAHYTAYHITQPINIDGHLDEPAWKQAPLSPRFIDIISGKPTIHDTRAAVMWDDKNLYIAYRVEEPFIHVKYTNYNDPIFHDNDVELFIAGRDSYYEFGLNALNTCYEIFFIWENAYKSGGFDQSPKFNRSQLFPFDGINFRNHPRGGRLVKREWSFPGKETAVWIDGTINNDSDRDRGWTVEIALPWKGMEWLAKADDRSLPPKEGDIWRMDFPRLNTYREAAPANDSGAWVWSRHSIRDCHIPECFPFIHFTTNALPTTASANVAK